MWASQHLGEEGNPAADELKRKVTQAAYNAAAVQTAWPIFQTGLLVPPPVNPPPSAWMPIGGG